MHEAMVNNVSTITSNNPVLIIGCGRIGSAILSGLLDNGLKKSAVSIVDPYLDLIKIYNLYVLNSQISDL